MENQLFRKKSLEHIASPEDIRDYMHISSPRLWMILSAVLAILIGFVIFASVTTIENSVACKANVMSVPDEEKDSYTMLLELPAGMGDLIDIGMEFRINELPGRITMVIENDDMTFASGDLDDQSVMLKSGTYDAEVILERITPLSFLMN